MKITSYVVDQPGGTRKVVQSPHTGENLVAIVGQAGCLTIAVETTVPPGARFPEEVTVYAFAPGYWSTLVGIPE
jgi:hypothetical protein